MKSPARLSLPKVEENTPDEKARNLLQQARQKLGMVPNMYANMANLPALLESYAFAYERFRQEGGFDPAEQEVIFLTISRENQCHYCVAAHSFLADNFSGVPKETLQAIREGKPVKDARLGALHRFVQGMVRQRGWVSQEEVDAFLEAGFTEKHILGIVLAIAVKTISNYSNHLFQTPVEAPFDAYAWNPQAATTT